MSSLFQEVKKLRDEKAQMENDVRFIAEKFQEFWKMLGLEFSEGGNSDKPSTMVIVKALSKVGMKLTTGKLKISDFMEKWETIQPIIAKYQHLVKTEENV